MENRNRIIDVYRGLAILLVTMFHVARWLNFDQAEAFGFLLKGWMGVGLFFVISGYCMGLSSAKIFVKGLNKENYLIYFTKRFLRLAFPYYASIVIWIFLIRIYGIAYKPTGLLDIYTHLFFIHNLSENTFFSISGVYWSLAVEMQFYLLLPVIIALCRTIKLQCIMLTVFFVASIILSICFTSKIITWGIPFYLPYFMMGWLVSIYKKSLFSVINRFKIHKISLIIVALIFLFGSYGYNSESKLIELIFSALLCISMCGFVEHDNNKRFILLIMSYIGQRSFSIYLYNYIFAIFQFKNLGRPDFIYVCAFVVAFGFVMYELIEKNSEKLRAKIVRKINFRTAKV